MTTPEEKPPLLWEQLREIRHRLMDSGFGPNPELAEVEKTMVDMLQIGEVEMVPEYPGNFRMASTEDMERVLEDVLWWANNIRAMVDMKRGDA